MPAVNSNPSIPKLSCDKALEPLEWLRESSEFGKSYVYTPEVLSAVKAAQRSGAEKVEVVNLPEAYLKDAGSLAQKRAAFAAHRLAAILGEDVKLTSN